MHGPSTHGAVTVAMPSTQTKCFLGSKDAYAKVGVPNCHGTSNWSNARTMRSRKHVLAKAAERLTTLVVFFGVASDDLPDEVDFFILGTDNTGSMTGWENVLAGLWEMVSLTAFC